MAGWAGWGGGGSPCVSVSSRCALSLLLLDPDQLQLFFALLVVCRQTLVLLQQLFVLLHQSGRVLLVLLVLVQLSDELLPAQRADEGSITPLRAATHFMIIGPQLYPFYLLAHFNEFHERIAKKRPLLE